MGQRVDYEALPSTRYDQYVPKLMTILRFAAGEGGTDFRPFRDVVRKQGIWDKDKGPAMFSLIDVTWDRKDVRLGPFARKLLAAGGDDQVKDLLFQRLADVNILLVKYVLEALDVESGGRLHSVHELYRMVSSYVYPGDYVSLPAFQAWVEWLAATGYIRMIGIRWGLSDAGLKVLPEYQSMDIEEILEDMEDEEAEDGSGPGEEDDLEPAAPGDAGPAPSVASGATDVPAFADDEDEDDDLLSGMPAPEPPRIAPASAPADGSVASQPAAPPSAVAPALAHAAVPGPSSAGPRATPGPVRLPLAGPSAPQPAAVVADPAEVAALVARASQWYGLWSRWPRVTAAILGVDTGPEGTEGDALMLELGVLAVLVEGVPLQPQLLAALQRIRQSGFYERLAAGDGGFGAAMDALGEVDKEPWLRAFVERLVHARAMRARLDARPDLFDRVAGCRDGATAVRLLRAELFGGAGHEAPFWVLRELVRDGMLDGVTFGDATAVPTPRLLRNAARVGIIARAEATSFDELVAASAAVSQHFDADTGYGEALEVLDRGLELSRHWL